MTTIFNFMAFLLVSISIAAAQAPSDVTVNVSGEDGQPIMNAEVAVWYIGVTGKDDVRITGNTNNKGTFKANGAADLRIKVEVTKDGYYKSEGSESPPRHQSHFASPITREPET